MTQTVQINKNSNKQTTKIVMYLLQEDFFPADSYGRALTAVKQEDSLGILWSPPQRTESTSVWNIFEHRQSSAQIARLSFVDVKGDETKEWSMCIFGQAYLDLGQKLARDLAKKFKVDIRLTSHQCREPEKHRWRILLNKFVQDSKLKIAKSI